MLEENGIITKLIHPDSKAKVLYHQPGRVNFIIRKPEAKWLSNVTFGGPDRKTLYVTCGDSVWKRKLSTTGVDPWKAPVTPPKPGL